MKICNEHHCEALYAEAIHSLSAINWIATAKKRLATPYTVMDTFVHEEARIST